MTGYENWDERSHYQDFIGTKNPSVENYENAPGGITYWKEYTVPANTNYVVDGIEADWIKDHGAKKIHFVMLQCHEPVGVQYDNGRIIIRTEWGVQGDANLDISGYKFKAWVWASTI